MVKFHINIHVVLILVFMYRPSIRVYILDIAIAAIDS